VKTAGRIYIKILPKM